MESEGKKEERKREGNKKQQNELIFKGRRRVREGGWHPPFFLHRPMTPSAPFCLGLLSSASKIKRKEGAKRKYVCAREVFKDVLASGRSRQKNAGSTILLRGMTPGDRGTAAATKAPEAA